jgi:hypothetical protein
MSLQTDNAELRAEVERLRGAPDRAPFVCPYSGSTSTYTTYVEGWNAAFKAIRAELSENN